MSKSRKLLEYIKELKESNSDIQLIHVESCMAFNNRETVLRFYDFAKENTTDVDGYTLEEYLKALLPVEELPNGYHYERDDNPYETSHYDLNFSYMVKVKGEDLLFNIDSESEVSGAFLVTVPMTPEDAHF